MDAGMNVQGELVSGNRSQGNDDLRFMELSGIPLPFGLGSTRNY
jgi:hypothetical protein